MNAYELDRHPSFLKSMQYKPLISSVTFLNTFFSWYKFLQKSNKFSQKQIATYQLERIQSIIRQGYNHVPYYKELFDKNKLKPSSIQSLSDIKKIPLLTKNDIKKNIMQIKARNYPANAFQKRSTGGTTGIPLYFYLEKSHWLGIHFAFNRIYMQQAGYQWSDKIISIAGINQQAKKHPFFKTIELSSFHTTSKDLDHYIQLINRFKPKFITSFPSALLLLTNHLLQTNKQINTHLKAIFCHGETLEEWQREYFKNTYNCNVFDQYGHREQCVFATTCTKSNTYHFFPQYGFIEILNKSEKPVTREGEVGEIIASSLTNYIFPFIRYKTDDLAQYTTKKCSCESTYPIVKKILGRTQEYLINKNNEKIPITGLYHLLSAQVQNIKECQLYQDTTGELIIHYVKDALFTEKNLKQLQRMLLEKLGKDFTLVFQSKELIRRTKHGKYQFIIQKIPITFT
jgi:phenylacetate-coenzyme A ligase PaaK-like adenylate-forming protein